MGSGFEVISVGKKKLVRSVPTELNKDHNEIIELAQVLSLVDLSPQNWNSFIPFYLISEAVVQYLVKNSCIGPFCSSSLYQYLHLRNLDEKLSIGYDVRLKVS